LASKPRLTFYGGVGEIGGNKVLLEDKDTRVFLDFGTGFSDGKKYYSSEVQPRKVNGLGDYFEFGLMPKIKGLYSRRALENTDLRYSEREIDAVFLSHYHHDHMGRIGFLDPEIPVYCGETTQLFAKAYHLAGGSPLDDQEIRTFRTGDKKKIGSLELIPVHVDHSIPGAYGFIIHYSEGTLVYTGDFRFHGLKGGMTQEFVDAAKRAQPDYLITEGTRVSAGDKKAELTEMQVFEKTAGILKGNKKLAFSTFRGNDIDRINTFYAAAKNTNRTLIVSMKTAMLLEHLKTDKNLTVPRLGIDVLAYIRRKDSGKYDDKDYYKWEREFLDKGVTCEDIRRKQGELFLHLDMWNLPEMIDIQPDPGGVYVHSSSEAYNEEGEEEEETIRNWVDHFGFSYNQIHASGHGPVSAVKRLTNEINAKVTIPIHTEHPELFSKIVRKEGVVLPEKNTTLNLA
jgi:ribonuclease J